MKKKLSSFIFSKLFDERSNSSNSINDWTTDLPLCINEIIWFCARLRVLIELGSSKRLSGLTRFDDRFRQSSPLKTLKFFSSHKLFFARLSSSTSSNRYLIGKLIFFFLLEKKNCCPQIFPMVFYRTLKNTFVSIGYKRVYFLWNDLHLPLVFYASHFSWLLKI